MCSEGIKLLCGLCLPLGKQNKMEGRMCVTEQRGEGSQGCESAGGGDLSHWVALL